MSRNSKISAALVAAFVVVIAVVTIAAGGSDDSAPSSETKATTPSADKPVAGTRVVASDPRTLGKPGSSGVTFTEFLDFECEACGAAFPAIEQLRREFAGRVTFNIRYFPIDSHTNARNAALAVEAAAQQGKLEPMYKLMFENQGSWAEQDSSRAAVFRGYAKDLGLDMEAFDAAVADPKTAARVERDSMAGRALGVQATPTFFIDEQLVEAQSIEDIRSQIEAAVRGS